MLGATEVLCICYMLFGQQRAVTNVFSAGHSWGQVRGKKNREWRLQNRLGSGLRQGQQTEISAWVWRLNEETLKVYWMWSAHS